MRNRAAMRTATISRLVLLVVTALLVGAMLVQGADAKPKPITGSIAYRVQAQRDLCELIGGGTMSTSTTPFGATITDCKGGTNDGQHCVNTKYSTNCTQTRMQPLPVDGNIGSIPVVGNDPVFASDPVVGADPPLIPIKTGGIAIPTGGMIANISESNDSPMSVFTSMTAEIPSDSASVTQGAQTEPVRVAGGPVVDDGAPAGVVTVAQEVAPALDQDAFKQGCEAGGGTYAENPDGSFQCQLRDGGMITCPDTATPCGYTPSSTVGQPDSPVDETVAVPADTQILEPTDDQDILINNDPIPVDTQILVPDDHRDILVNDDPVPVDAAILVPTDDQGTVTIDHEQP